MNISCYLLIRLHHWFNIIYESIQEAQFNNNSVIGDMLTLVSNKFEENKELCLRNDDDNNATDEIPYKKQNQRMAVQLINRFLFNTKFLRKQRMLFEE